MGRVERRGRRLGLISIQLAIALAIVGVWVPTLTAWPPFDYWVVPSLLPTYGLIGLTSSVFLWLVLLRFSGFRAATLIVGASIVLAGLGLGFSPITSGGHTGWCQSVLGNIGLHGDDREDCFDARASRADDVAVVLTFGLLVTAVGSALVAHRAGRGTERPPHDLAPGGDHEHVLTDASETGSPGRMSLFSRLPPDSTWSTSGLWIWSLMAVAYLLVGIEATQRRGDRGRGAARNRSASRDDVPPRSSCASGRASEFEDRM